MAPGWQIVHGAILATSFLEVSFQRYSRPSEGRIEAAPSSYGALPVALVASNEALVPLDAAEAIWVGLAARRRGVVVLLRAGVETERGLLDATTSAAWGAQPNGVLVPPARSLEGIVAPEGGFWPIARVAAVPGAPSTSALRIEAVPSSARGRRISRPQGPRRQHALGPSGGPEEPSDPAEGAWLPDEAERVRIALIDPEEFTAVTELRWEPLDERARYAGWRLP